MIDDYEEFSPAEREILEHYVTSTSKNIFVLRNLPEVIKGALFSRYSRSTLGLRTLLLKEFILNEGETAFGEIVPTKGDVQKDDQIFALQKAQNFYDRILDGYGDDSIGELGGAHLAIENISMLAAKAIEDCRLGGSPLEKSTRYIYFDQKVNGEYRFYRESILMTSAYREEYLAMCNDLFETYASLIPELTQVMEKRFPKDSGTSQGAYSASIRAKVLDCLRGLLPASTLTNMGLFANGRFYESLIHKLHCSPLEELQSIGKKSFEELHKVIPSFIRRAAIDHRTHDSYASYSEVLGSALRGVVGKFIEGDSERKKAGVRLISSTPKADRKVAAALLYPHASLSLEELVSLCEQLSAEEIEQILDAGCSARENRRQKSPRGLEHAEFTFEIIADFGCYRDLQRHRILTQERQLLTCEYGYYVPEEFQGLPQIENPYREALERAEKVWRKISAELPEEAQYVVPMAYNIRWYFKLNLRAIQWITELRSAPAGHSAYRFVAQEMARQVIEKYPQFERFLRFVDYQGYDLGRLSQEERKEQKQRLFSQT